MGKHKIWRNNVKKLRRKRIRQKLAKHRDYLREQEETEFKKTTAYLEACKEQQILEKFQEEEYRRISKVQEQEWLRRETEAQKLWIEKQKLIAKINDEKERQKEIIRQEWEREQKLIAEKEKEIQEQLIIEQNKQDLFTKQLDEFLCNRGPIPPDLDMTIETNPGKEICPFFQKTATCRFKDYCSRNHVRPTISSVLLINGFYSHFAIEHSNQKEYDSDILLEYDDRETYIHFCDFFNDIVPELEKFGNVIQLKICKNHEAHLRGNVYVEYSDVREAVKAYQSLQGRWYGGKQIHIDFVKIATWKQAICGTYNHNKCPKGKNCNFLHVFKNPHNLFSEINTYGSNIQRETDTSLSRWSESPEPYVNENDNKKYCHKNDKKYRHDNGNKKDSRENDKYRSRSKKVKEYSRTNYKKNDYKKTKKSKRSRTPVDKKYSRSHHTSKSQRK